MTELKGTESQLLAHVREAVARDELHARCWSRIWSASWTHA